MNSSISSSDALPARVALRPLGRTARILLALALALVVVEGLTRWKFVRMSHEFEQFGSYPARAAALAHQPGLRLLVLGPSIVHENVDAPLLAERLRSAGFRPLHVDAFSADHSYVDSWYFMLQHYFWRPGHQVDLVVIPFVGASLYDGNELEIGRLARYFTDVVDWPDVFRLSLTATGDRADFLASSLWASFAARDRMQELALTLLLPDYKGYANAHQAALIDHQRAHPRETPGRVHTTRVLERLLETARTHGTRLCFVAFPSLHTEWNDAYADIRGLIARDGMEYLDLRRVPDVDEHSFVDLVHMNPAGRGAFTGRLAQALVPIVGPATTAQIGRTSAAAAAAGS